MGHIEIEHEVKFEALKVPEPDYKSWLVLETKHFAYGYLSPTTRVRLTLIEPVKEVKLFNVSEAFMETKVWVKNDMRLKIVDSLEHEVAIRVFGDAARTLFKTTRIYEEMRTSWMLSFDLGTWDLNTVECTSPNTLVKLPNFAGERTDRNMTATFDRADEDDNRGH